jgi:hypothetical protein
MSTSVQLNAFLTEWSSLKAHELHTADPKRLANALLFSASDSMGADCIKVGTATVTVHLAEPEAYVAEAVAGLRKQQQELRAEAERKANAIELQIGKLLAISYTEAA